MAAATGAEKVSAAGSFQGFLLGRALRDGKGERWRRCLCAGPGRRRYCGAWVGGEGPAWAFGTRG